MSKCLMGPKFITEINEETSPSINLTPDKVGGISEYTCTTSEGNHALVGQGDNIKFIADANYSEGNTITVNGKTVTAKLQNGEPLSSDAWIAGAVVTCYLNGDILNFKGGNGLNSEDKAKLIPENIREGVTLFAGTPKEVVGKVVPYVLYASGQSNGDTWGSWLNAKSTVFESPNQEFTGTNGQPTFTVNKTGIYHFKVVLTSSAGTIQNQDGLVGFRLLRQGSTVPGTEFNGVSSSSMREFNVTLNEGDVLTWQIYVRHVAYTFYNFLFVCLEPDA